VIVLDASAAVEWLLGRRGAGHVSNRIADPDVPVHAPTLLGVEVAAAMRGLARGGHVSADRALAAVTDLVSAGFDLHDPTPLLARAWALRENLTTYDAVYVALAETLDATLLTADARIARAPGVRARVEVVPSQ
jgi:predicted nucleic acid-binding protein